MHDPITLENTNSDALKECIKKRANEEQILDKDLQDTILEQVLSFSKKLLNILK